MNITDYKNIIENLEKTIADLDQIVDKKTELKSAKSKKIFRTEYDKNKAQHSLKILEQKKYQISHYDELKKEEKFNSIAITVFLTCIYLTASLLVLLTPLSYGAVASLGTLAIIVLGIKRYYSSVIPTLKLKKEVERGNRNLEQEIIDAKEEVKRIENKISNLKNSVEILKNDIENVKKIKTEIQLDITKQKECLYSTIEELLQDVDLDDMMNEKISKMEKETIKEKSYSKKN